VGVGVGGWSKLRIRLNSAQFKLNLPVGAELGNNENIENRQKQGTKTISNLLSILKEIGFGSYYVKIGLIYRDAILKPKLLLNSEVWHGLTQQQVSVLEAVDRTYLRTILSSHSNVAIECLHFETGTMPLKYDLMKRKLMYLWKILHVEETELISRVTAKFFPHIMEIGYDW
jgi:hypothetical protein